MLQKKRLLSSFFAVLALIIAGLLIGATLNGPTTPLPEADLEANALRAARALGLEGEPTARRTMIMTYGEWLKVTGGELGSDTPSVTGETEDMPVFVLILKGKVVWKGAGVPIMGGSSAPDVYDNMIIVLDARDGSVLETAVSPPGSPMLVPIP